VKQDFEDNSNNEHDSGKGENVLACEFHAFLTFDLGGDDWSVSCFGRFTVEEKKPGNLWGQKWLWTWWKQAS
jgi:hypothetical protein